MALAEIRRCVGWFPPWPQRILREVYISRRTMVSNLIKVETRP